MAATLSPEVMQDDVAVSLARSMAAANKKARELGIQVSQSLISIAQQDVQDGSVWRINYGPKDYINRRGGDILIEVDIRDAKVMRVLRGQ